MGKEDAHENFKQVFVCKRFTISNNNIRAKGRFGDGAYEWFKNEGNTKTYVALDEGNGVCPTN